VNKISGIYQIQSKCKPERIYIGSSADINNRWAIHLFYLTHNKHHSKKLQHHYNKYGKDDLLFSVLITCEKEQLIQFEQYYLDFYHPWFNVCQFAGSVRGRETSSESRIRYSKAKLGFKMPKEAVERIRKHNLGRIPWNKDKLLSEEHKEKLRISHTGKKLPLFTEEHKRNIGKANAIALLGRKQSIYTKNKRAQKLSIPTLQYTLDGVFVKEWPSAAQAAKELLVAQNGICSCRAGTRASSYGFIWKYKI